MERIYCIFGTTRLFIAFGIYRKKERNPRAITSGRLLATFSAMDDNTARQAPENFRGGGLWEGLKGTPGWDNFQALHPGHRSK